MKSSGIVTALSVLEFGVEIELLYLLGDLGMPSCACSRLCVSDAPMSILHWPVILHAPQIHQQPAACVAIELSIRCAVCNASLEVRKSTPYLTMAGAMTDRSYLPGKVSAHNNASR